MDDPVFDYGGSGQVVHLAGGNGFPPEVYGPMLESLLDDHRVVAALPRPLWPNPPLPETVVTWQTFADDLLKALDRHQLTDVVAIGHSMGGIVSIVAAVTEPERFSRLVLVDPALFLPKVLQKMADSGSSPLAEQALRRRDKFASLDEAFAYWREKPFFKQWPDDMLRLYAEGLLKQGTDRLELRWPTAWEARIFNTPFIDAWDYIARLPSTLPVLAVRGTTTDVFRESVAQMFQEVVPHATVKEVPDHGHTFPMTAAEQTGRIIRDWLDS